MPTYTLIHPSHMILRESYSYSIANLQGICWDGSNWFLVKESEKKVYKYNSSWEYVTQYDLNAGQDIPYGICWDGTYFYITDSQVRVYQYNSDFSSLEDTHDLNVLSAGANFDPKGICYNSTSSSFFIVDETDAKVYEYASDFSSLDDSYDIGILGGNDSPYGICWDGTYFWVSDSDGYIYQYNSSFTTLIESHNVGALGGNDSPYGVDYDGSYYYVADSDENIYQYEYKPDENITDYICRPNQTYIWHPTKDIPNAIIYYNTDEGPTIEADDKILITDKLNSQNYYPIVQEPLQRELSQWCEELGFARIYLTNYTSLEKFKKDSKYDRTNTHYDPIKEIVDIRVNPINQNQEWVILHELTHPAFIELCDKYDFGITKALINYFNESPIFQELWFCLQDLFSDYFFTKYEYYRMLKTSVFEVDLEMCIESNRIKKTDFKNLLTAFIERNFSYMYHFTEKERKKLHNDFKWLMDKFQEDLFKRAKIEKIKFTKAEIINIFQILKSFKKVEKCESPKEIVDFCNEFAIELFQATNLFDFEEIRKAFQDNHKECLKIQELVKQKRIDYKIQLLEEMGIKIERREEIEE